MWTVLLIISRGSTRPSGKRSMFVMRGMMLVAKRQPTHLVEMIKSAEILADGWDFIRVDFYDTPQRFYFGELTLAPNAGHATFFPEEFDSYLGSLWKTRTDIGR